MSDANEETAAAQLRPDPAGAEGMAARLAAAAASASAGGATVHGAHKPPSPIGETATSIALARAKLGR